jgi:hypothetical protein
VVLCFLLLNRFSPQLPYSSTIWRNSDPELGAVLSRDDIRQIVLKLLDTLGAGEYRPEIGLWHHSTTNGWNVSLDRQHLGLTSEALTATLQDAIAKTTDEIKIVLGRRRAECIKLLETLTKCG